MKTMWNTIISAGAAIESFRRYINYLRRARKLQGGHQ